jgi:hypothetical protein
MRMTIRISLCLACVAAVLSCFSCTKEVQRDNDTGSVDLPHTDLDIEKRFLEEGFITDDLFRVVIVTTKEGSSDMAALKKRASNRALVSLERSLTAENIPSDRNVKAAILGLIDKSGQLVKKEIEHKRYNVFYFDITRKNMVTYFRNIASQR